MKSGPTPWTTKCPATCIARARDMLAARRKPREIFDTLNLQAHVPFHTFRRWCTRMRRELSHRRDSAGPSEDGAMPSASAQSACHSSSSSAHPDRILAATLQAMELAVATDSVPAYKLPDYIRAMVVLRDLALSEQADRRAEELHAVKLSELKAAQERALETVSTTSQLTPEQVAEIRLKVLGL